MLMPNALRDRLDRDQPTISTHFMFTDADIPEIIGDTGLFDYAEFVAEYSTFDMGLLYHLARAGQCGGNLPLMIKLDQEGQGFWAQAALGAGFKAVLFTDIRTPEDVDTCHRVMAPDTPNTGGAMGVKLRRPALTSYDT
ncbi:MAG: 2,4-dihydroxyhept-2-ene-1,7-dioic acid aldolase, partial [Acidimicrobiia bacterium]|nr:2,4-dihydroxyhept-2-ene-1,7-dioic acid aldolase [Acidimicrobiia bacterium]